ncbi:hypothetical protein AVEN_245236-1 [Araneus ventricosus]|uniref:Uncharacterized protein n=1 Tax=Araneus ventricosus TaxID=182803 RepID=A0A4Y2VQA7_ARAVE|nr:hypothetical protein AVEN_245236-1 [Araneus ventricosus]
MGLNVCGGALSPREKKKTVTNCYQVGPEILKAIDHSSIHPSTTHPSIHHSSIHTPLIHPSTTHPSNRRQKGYWFRHLTASISMETSCTQRC